MGVENATLQFGWDYKKLGQICKIIGGGTPSKREAKYYGGQIPWATVRDMNQDLLKSTDQTITAEGLSNSSSNLIPKGTIIIATRVGLGKVCILNQDTAINQDLKAIIPNKLLLDRDYLFYWYKSVSDLVVSHGTGMTVKGVRLSFIKDLTIPLPPLPTQRAIVAHLDAAFARIDRARANLERNVANARELFQAKLNEVFSRRGDGWEEKTLLEVATYFGRGKSKHRPRNDKSLYGGNYPFVQTGDVRNTTKYISEFTQTYNEKGLAQSKLWNEGTVCITIAANIAEVGILEFKACFPDNIIGLQVDPNSTTSEYCYYALIYLQNILKAQGKGSAQDNINLGTFQNQLFPFPSLQKQTEIVDFLNNLIEEIDVLNDNYQTQIDNIANLKQSLLQKAFRGELIAEAESASAAH